MKFILFTMWWISWVFHCRFTFSLIQKNDHSSISENFLLLFYHTSFSTMAICIM